MLLGAAMLLAEDPPPGGVRFLFQPAEEGPDEEGKSGGMRFVDEGVMESVLAVFGLHVSGDYPVGTVAVSPGPVQASADLFDLEIVGRGCHGAYPHKGIDPILIAAHVIVAIQQIVARRVNPIRSGVVTVGAMHSGTKHNIIPDKAFLKGTTRSFDPEVRRQIGEELETACGVARALGGDFNLSIVEGYPPTVNDPDAAAFAHRVACSVLDESSVIAAEPRMGAEDFSLLAQEAPGCFCRLGVRTPGEPERRGHSSTFDIDEGALPIGAALLASLASKWLEEAQAD
jgi:amidohydrolase